MNYVWQRQPLQNLCVLCYYHLLKCVSLKRFSFEISENGTIGHVRYPRGESEHVLVTKKGMASLLAANLQHPPDDEVCNNFIILLFSRMLHCNTATHTAEFVAKVIHER